MSAAHDIQTAVLARLAEMSQGRVAEVAGVSDATVSRWKANDLETCAKLLAAMGLTVVAAGHRMPDPKYLACLEHLARMTLDREGVH